MRRRKTVFVDGDILVVVGGMGGCGATYENWGRDLKNVCVEKANIERSGAVAQGLSIGSTDSSGATSAPRYGESFRARVEPERHLLLAPSITP
jgi:hypothetical protein